MRLSFILTLLECVWGKTLGLASKLALIRSEQERRKVNLSAASKNMFVYFSRPSKNTSGRRRSH